MEKGYTLIELLVSISITVILLGLGFSSFRSFGAASELDTGADRIRSVLLEARNLAFSPESGTSQDIAFYGVRFNVENNSFDLVRIKDEDLESEVNLCQIENIVQPSVESFGLSELVRLTSAPDLVCFEINPNADVSFLRGNSIIIEHGRTTRQKQLTINGTTGQIDITSVNQTANE